MLIFTGSDERKLNRLASVNRPSRMVDLIPFSSEGRSCSACWPHEAVANIPGVRTNPMIPIAIREALSVLSPSESMMRRSKQQLASKLHRSRLVDLRRRDDAECGITGIRIRRVEARMVEGIERVKT